LAIKAALEADTDLMALVSGVYYAIAPNEATYPFLIIDPMPSPNDEYTLTQRVRKIWRFQIKTIEEGYSIKNAVSADVRVEAVLQDSTLDVTGETTIFMRQQAPVHYPQVAPNGRVFQHYGHEWRIEQRED